jgi:phage terminase large subunit-like protein
VWNTGAEAHIFSAEDPDSLRGPQFHGAWADEFCAWRRPGEGLAMLRFGLRLGEDPRLLVTTTPRPIAALRALRAEASTVDTVLPTATNAHNLAPAFLDSLNAIYGGTRLAAQELEGLIVDGEGALWRAEDLARCRGARPPGFDRVVVAVDPPATATGDACGIVVAGRLGERAFVLADRTMKGLSPMGWARRAVETARDFGAAAIVAEANQGGEMVRGLLAQAGGAYLVGERGPEVFRPAGAGTVEPVGGGGGMTINVTVEGGGAEGLVRSDAQIAQALARAVGLGARRL